MQESTYYTHFFRVILRTWPNVGRITVEKWSLSTYEVLNEENVKKLKDLSKADRQRAKYASSDERLFAESKFKTEDHVLALEDGSSDTSDAIFKKRDLHEVIVVVLAPKRP